MSIADATATPPSVAGHVVDASTGLLDPLATWRALSSEQQESIGVAAIVHALGLLGEAEGMEPAQGWAAADIEGMQALANAVREAIVPVRILLCHRPMLTAIDVHACRRCGCTEQCACPSGCSWEEADLCSACGDVERALADVLAVAGYAVTNRPSGMVLITAPATGGAWHGALIFTSVSWEQTLSTLLAVEVETDDQADSASAMLDSRIGDLLGSSQHCVPEPIAVAAVELTEAHPGAALASIVPLVSALADHFGTAPSLDAAAAVRWMTEAQLSLGGAVPMSLLVEGDTDTVIGAVGQLLRA